MWWLCVEDQLLSSALKKVKMREHWIILDTCTSAAYLCLLAHFFTRHSKRSDVKHHVQSLRPAKILYRAGNAITFYAYLNSHSDSVSVSNIQDQKLYFASIGIDQIILFFFISRRADVHRSNSITTCDEQKLLAKLG
jgi:hypothetical protein